jgi:hypothetical protein
MTTFKVPDFESKGGNLISKFIYLSSSRFPISFVMQLRFPTIGTHPDFVIGQNPNALEETTRNTSLRNAELLFVPSSGDENGSDSMKYWEVVADKLHAAGWSWGYGSAATKDGWRWWIV